MSYEIKCTLISSYYILSLFLRKKLSIDWMKTEDIGVWAIFCQGGAVNHLPKKILQVAQIFTKQSNRNEGRCNNIGRTGIWKWLDTVFQSQYLPSLSINYRRRHKQTFGKIATTVVLDKDENLLWSGLQWHRSCYSNEMKPLPIILAAIFLSGNCSSKIDHRSFFLQ